jgi:hypothetical protein
MMLGENDDLKDRTARADKPVSALDPAVLAQRFAHSAVSRGVCSPPGDVISTLRAR